MNNNQSFFSFPAARVAAAFGRNLRQGHSPQTRTSSASTRHAGLQAMVVAILQVVHRNGKALLGALLLTALAVTAPVQAQSTGPQVSITSPADNTLVIAPATLTLSAQATAAAGSTIVRVDFYRNNSLIASATTPSQGTNVNGTWSAVWNLATPGNYDITARAIDNLGRIGISEDIDLQAKRINAADPPPTVSIASPTAGQSFTAGTNITLSATAGDNNAVMQVQFYDGATLIGNATLSTGTNKSGTWSLTWPNVAPGSYPVAETVPFMPIHLTA